MLQKFHIQSVVGRRVAWAAALAVTVFLLVNVVAWVIQDEVWKAEKWEENTARNIFWLVLPCLCLVTYMLLGRLAERLIALAPHLSPSQRKGAMWWGTIQMLWFTIYCIFASQEDGLGRRALEGLGVEFVVVPLLSCAAFLSAWAAIALLQVVRLRMPVASVGGQRLVLFGGVLGASVLSAVAIMALGSEGSDLLNVWFFFSHYFWISTILLYFVASVFLIGGSIWVFEGFKQPQSSAERTSGLLPSGHHKVAGDGRTGSDVTSPERRVPVT
jgi:hypothetical protein